MESKKLIIAVVLLAIFGLGTEALKKFNLIGSNKNSAIETVNIAGMDLTPYYRSNQKDDAQPEKQALKKAFSLAAVPTNLEGSLDLGKDKKAAGKQIAKDDKKKKKKKKKKVAKKKPEFDQTQKAAEVYAEKKNESKSDEEENNTAAANGAVNAAAATAPENISTSDEFAKWSAKLLGSANKAAMMVFIREYQSGNVSVEVFYQILDAMYAQRSEEFKSLAVLGAGATPSLLSFQFLAEAYANSSSSRVSSEILVEVNDYTLLQHLWVANSALTAGQNANAAYLAAIAFNESTNRYLSTSGSTNPSTSNGRLIRTEMSNRNPSSNATTALRIYQGYLSNLQAAASRYANEPEIAQPLKSAIDRIQSQLQLVAGI